MAKPYADMFLAEIGHAWRIEGDACIGALDAVPELCAPGTDAIRPSVLAAAADVVAGIVANQTIGPRIPLTVDLMYRSISPGIRRVGMVARNLKVGRTTVVSEVIFTAGDGETPVGVSHATFIGSPRPDDVMADMHWERPHAPPTLDRPIADRLGCVEIAPGVVELARREYVMQPSGTIQGGAIAILAEVAAAGIAQAPIVDLEIRYLSAVRVGPARTASTMLGDRIVRVEVRDVGNADRLSSLVLAGVRPT